MPLRPPAGYIRPGYDPLEVADAPTVGTATAGDTTASVAFTAPSNVGGSAITNYYAVSNPGQITATSATSPVTVTGLTNGTSYTFRVWALNSYGPSPYSGTSGSVTPTPPFIEDVFSTWLYTGNGSTQTITNGIDLSGKGGLVWLKSRNAATDHALYDTVRGATFDIASNLLDTQTTQSTGLTSFGSTGFSIGSLAKINTNSNTYVSWTFREQPKFFDVVTYTGNGVGGRTVAHNLGSVPGCIIVKRLDGAIANWAVYHRSLGNTERLFLNSTFSQSTDSSYWNNTNPSSTVFTVGTNGNVNESGATYVAYLFAHDAGGFGLTGTDNVISCGSYTGNTTTRPTITLGYEPQWILVKQSSGAGGNWTLVDNMRGLGQASASLVDAANAAYLAPNTSSAEANATNFIGVTATGFSPIAGSLVNANGETYIYIAIRRGPMKTPTSGTSVFSPALISGTGSSQTISSPGFAPDLVFGGNRSSNPLKSWVDKLRGRGRVLQSYDTSAEASSATNQDLTAFLNTGFSLAADWNTSFNTSGSSNNILWTLQRAPGFFDVVCYTGTGSNLTQSHNLGVAPELMIFKRRDSTSNWQTYCSYLNGGVTPESYFLFLNVDNAIGGPTVNAWNNTAPTSTQFTVGVAANVNASGGTYVAYLFATVAGVSKVGSYTGTGATLQINCGFTGGARFVLIKRTDSTGDWYVWDSARGIVAGNDPYLLLNSTAAEVTNTDWVDTHSPGFELSNAAGNNVNINGGTFIFLAIA